MLNPSWLIVDSLKMYLKNCRIPYNIREQVGILTFSAAAETGGEAYDHHINVSARDFWITVKVPVEIPRSEKVNIRLARFCARVNLTDNTGGFLAMEEREGRLLYRLRVVCIGDLDRILETMLPLPAQMVHHYSQMVRLLTQGKISQEEALRTLGRNFPVYSTPRLAPPVKKDPENRDPAMEERKRLLRKAIEEYLREKSQSEATQRNEKGDNNAPV